MPKYTPPAGNAVNFALQPTIISNDFILDLAPYTGALTAVITLVSSTYWERVRVKFCLDGKITLDVINLQGLLPPEITPQS